MCYLRYSEDCTDQHRSRGRGCTLVPYNSCFADIFYVHWRMKRKMEVFCIWTCDSACNLTCPGLILQGTLSLFLSQLVPALHLPQPYLVCRSFPSLPSTRFSFLNNADPPTHSVFAIENTFHVPFGELHVLCGRQRGGALSRSNWS